jgi:predicted nuclease with RNAse H fold
MLGIDLSSADEGTAGCIVRWDGGVGHVERLAQPLSDADIVELARISDLVAIDAPLGWPAAFVAAVTGHARGEAWPSVGLRDLRFRATDHHVRDNVGWWPLSVSSDLIGVVAFRAARLVSLLRPGASARDGSNGLLEVYPAAALARWSLPHLGYKKRAHTAERLAILAGLERVVEVEMTAVQEQLARSSDCLDSLVAAIVARALAIGRTDPIPVGHRAIAAVEGWIHLPTGAPLRE